MGERRLGNELQYRKWRRVFVTFSFHHPPYPSPGSTVAVYIYKTGPNRTGQSISFPRPRLGFPFLLCSSPRSHSRGFLRDYIHIYGPVFDSLHMNRKEPQSDTIEALQIQLVGRCGVLHFRCQSKRRRLGIRSPRGVLDSILLFMPTTDPLFGFSLILTSRRASLSAFLW
jgi:hypothetical protein